MTTQETINDIILKKLGLEDLPAELQAEFVLELGTLIMKAIFLRAVEVLPEEKHAEFTTLTGNPDTEPDAVLAFLEENIPDFESVVTEEGNRILENWEAASADAVV